jgi:chemotaxis protein histidine kinase CheA
MTEFDSATLALITQETRACFLSEDVPGYMLSLRQSLAQLQQGQLDFTAIMHALHSLKGGSGISQLFHLNRFTHKLEDLMELLRDRGISDYQNLSHILAQSIDEIDGVLATVQTLPADSLADVAIDQKAVVGRAIKGARSSK